MFTRNAIVFAILLSAMFTTGCVREQTAQITYTPEATYVEPVSDRAATRLYPNPVRAQLTTSEIAIAQQIQQLLQGSGVDTASNNIRAIINQGTVTLQGTVPTANLRRELEDRISIMSGVKGVENQLEVELK